MTTSALSDWLGTGWAHPIAPDASLHHLRYTEGPEKVRQSIKLILLTEPGERVMRPSFGCGLGQFLMEPNTIATRALIDAEVRQAIELWEPRVQLKDVTTEAGPDPSLVIITIRYEHRRTGRSDALIFPYALEAPR
jgi:phage baseplate assembly protein W